MPHKTSITKFAFATMANVNQLWGFVAPRNPKFITSMKKLALLLCVCLGGSLLAQAQISTGENTAQTIRTGNRAAKGDFGLYLGATTDHFKSIGDATNFAALPLLNFKYMTSDKVEARLGFEWWSKTETTSYNPEEGDSYKSSARNTSIMFYPGVAYHFNRSNILDVYVGAELPIGGGSEATKVSYDGDDDEEDGNTTANRFEIGVGAFIGLQAYICNLPLAVGVEYGFNIRNQHYGNSIVTQDGFSYAKDNSYNKFVLGNQARLTLTYFFKL